ncbi:MAG TPA: hypothetical protein VMT29_06370 [Steroidobacteraceae bacterium]|nr:hypothetical protein [Steroidobacteraceae bacterium]
MHARIGVVGLLALLAVTTHVGLAAAAVTPTPNPPPQVCIGSKCVNSQTSTPSKDGPIKWNPGHYMASNTVLQRGTTMSRIQTEVDDLGPYDNIIGYRVFTTWGALEPTQGNYDFSVLDAILNRLKTQYRKPKHMVVVVLPGPFGSAPLGKNDTGTVPGYIQAGSQYGNSPVAGSYGWWGKNANGVSTGNFVAAIYRSSVMDRYIALMQALGAHYDGDQYFEGIMFQEGAWMLSVWSGAPDYSESGFSTQLKRLLSATTAAFPHTNVIMENTWLTSVPGTRDLEAWMIANRIAPGSADSVGQSAFDNYSYATAPQGLNWGLQAYLGIANGTSNPMPDQRPNAAAMLDVESFDTAGNYYARFGGPFDPADILAAMNKTYKASHVFWVHLYGAENVRGSAPPAAAKWTNMAPMLNANPLARTAYPANYPN